MDYPLPLCAGARVLLTEKHRYLLSDFPLPALGPSLAPLEREAEGGIRYRNRTRRHSRQVPGQRKNRRNGGGTQSGARHQPCDFLQQSDRQRHPGILSAGKDTENIPLRRLPAPHDDFDL